MNYIYLKTHAKTIEMKPYLILAQLLLTFTFVKAQELTVVDFSEDFDNIRDFTISQNGKIAYFSLQSGLSEVSVLVQVEKVNNVWSNPQLLPFSGKYKDLEPFLSPDNLRLYFASNRPLSAKQNEPKDFDIWYVERENKHQTWGAPINIGKPINTDLDEFYPSISNNLHLYFTKAEPNKKDNIYVSRWKNDTYSTPQELSENINTNGYEFNAYIAPDESYIIFTGYARENGLGSGDLYISYKNKDGKWKPAVSMGKTTNSKQMDYCPFVHTATNTLYFTSKRSVFESVNDFKDINEVIIELNKSENGKSKIYKVPFTPQP